MADTMATSHQMTGRYIPIFDLNSLIFTISLGEFFFLLFFATLGKYLQIEVVKSQGRSDGVANILQFVIFLNIFESP